MDVSADLTELGRTPVAVVCAGAKSILDIPRTLEYLETQVMQSSSTSSASAQAPRQALSALHRHGDVAWQFLTHQSHQRQS